jgi:predicted nucleotidyltransferase
MHKENETGLQDSDLDDILRIFQKNVRINKIILFGSRAKGTFKSGSDIDLAISGNDLKINDILDLSIELDELDLPYKFDIIILERIKEKSLLEHISRVGIDIFNKLSIKNNSESILD